MAKSKQFSMATDYYSSFFLISYAALRLQRKMMRILYETAIFLVEWGPWIAGFQIVQSSEWWGLEPNMFDKSY